MLSQLNNMFKEISEIRIEDTIVFNIQIMLIERFVEGGFERDYAEELVSRIDLSIPGYITSVNKSYINEIVGNFYILLNNYYKALSKKCNNPDKMLLNFVQNMNFSS